MRPAIIVLPLFVFACVGSDPATVAATTSDAGTPNDAATTSPPDSGAATGPTCAGQAFPTPVVLTTTLTSFALLSDLRVVGTTAYYAGTVKSGLEATEQLYFGTYQPGTAPSFGGQALLVSGLASSTLRVPAVSKDETMVVFTDVNDLYGLRVAYRSGQAFGASQLITALNQNDRSQTGSWLVQTDPPSALYFVRGSSPDTALTINRSAITMTNGVATFGTDTFISVRCDVGTSCEAPVVSADESMMIYATTPDGASPSLSVFEVALTKTNGLVNVSGAPIPQPSVDKLMPTWLSDDGCELILVATGAAGTGNTFFYSRRVAK